MRSTSGSFVRCEATADRGGQSPGSVPVRAQSTAADLGGNCSITRQISDRRVMVGTWPAQGSIIGLAFGMNLAFDLMITDRAAQLAARRDGGSKTVIHFLHRLHGLRPLRDHREDDLVPVIVC